MRATWSLLSPEPEPVPVEEALKAYKNEKVIECEWIGCRFTYTPPKRNQRNWLKDENGNPVSADEILHGKWYIKA
jgi:hypothetical protein